MPNPNYKDTVTIYNCHKAKDNGTGKDIWYKAVIENCFFKSSEVQNVSGTTLEKAPSYTCRIPDNEKYLSYAEWVKLTDKTGKFTVSTNDIVILGEISDNITVVSPYTASEILGKYKPDSFKVMTFSNNTKYHGAHIKVGG